MVPILDSDLVVIFNYEERDYLNVKTGSWGPLESASTFPIAEACKIIGGRYLTFQIFSVEQAILSEVMSS